MGYIDEIERYMPVNGQEEQDRQTILAYIESFPDTVLRRENKLAHLTSSGFIVNKDRSKALLAHHNIMDKWAWTGGHLDGEADMLGVALREGREETGVVSVEPLGQQIASLDILPVEAHERKGQYVNAHLHLSIAYLLVCDETEQVRVREGENSDVAWLELESFTRERFDAYDTYLYQKLIKKAKI